MYWVLSVQTVAGEKLFGVTEVHRTKVSATSKCLLSKKRRQIHRKSDGYDDQPKLLLQNTSMLA